MTSIHNRLTTLRRDERGISNMLVGFGFIGFMAATVLALDVGLLVVARSQAQNSADAGALAGAVALVFNDFNNRSADRPGRHERDQCRRANAVGWRPGRRRSGGCDVPARTDRPEQPRRRRCVERPIPTILGAIFGDDVDATAGPTREGRSVAGERRALPAAVHDSRQVDEK